MAQEIYHRSEWGNPTETWGNTYLNADLTNELYKRASEYENSWVTDQLLNGVGTKPSIILTPTAYEDGILNSVKPVQSLGSELITNGDFSTDSGWSYGSSWSIANGKATATNSTTGSIYQDILDTSKIYKATFEITEITSGSLRIGIGVNFSDYFTSTGIYTYYGQPTTDGLLRINPLSGTNASIDNVSVKEVIDADFYFTRGSSATRISEKGLVQDVQLLSGELVQNGDFEQIGSELVTNGTFDTDSDWTKGTGWSISNGKAIGSNSSSSLYQATGSNYTSGKTYKIVFTVSDYVSGSVRPEITNIAGEYVTSNGTFTQYIVATSSAIGEELKGASFTGSIDNVSVKEVGQNWTFFGEAEFTENGARIYSSSGSNSYIGQTILTNTKKYRLSYEIVDSTQGGLKLINVNGVSDYSIPSTLGTHSIDFIANNPSFFILRDSGITDVTIDNVSVIEITDSTDLPRINYKDGEGSLLLENQSTNLITYSEDFSEWSPTNIVLTEDVVISPDGTTTADKIAGTSVTSQHRVNFTSTNVSGATTFSFFAKSGEYTSCWARIGFSNAYFDLENGVSSQGSGVISSIENYGNGWYRCIMTKTSSSANEVCRINITTSYLDTSDFLGDNTSGIYLWGAQAEALSYATSYIVSNSGSTTTRLADVCNNSGNSDLINSTEGVLYAEISALAENSGLRFISLYNASDTSSRIEIRYNNSTSTMRFTYVSTSNVYLFEDSVSSSQLDNIKLAFVFKTNRFAVYVNGNKLNEQLSGNANASGIDTLDFDQFTAAFPFYGNVKCLAVFKEALSDTELQKLTTI